MRELFATRKKSGKESDQLRAISSELSIPPVDSAKKHQNPTSHNTGYPGPDVFRTPGYPVRPFSVEFSLMTGSYFVTPISVSEYAGRVLDRRRVIGAFIMTGSIRVNSIVGCGRPAPCI